MITSRPSRGVRIISALAACAGLVMVLGSVSNAAVAQPAQTSDPPPSGASAKQPPQKGASAAKSPGSLFPGGNSKDPINIEADRLEYYNKEQRAVYIGNVVAVQGDSTLKCTKLTIFLEKQDDSKSGAPKPAPGPAPGGTGQVKRMEAEGPVSLFSKDQNGTGDRGEYDKSVNKLFLYGHVMLTQGTNITKGDKLTYDLSTGVAFVESGQTSQRVSGFFIPGSSADEKSGSDKTPNDKGTTDKSGTKPPAKSARSKPKKPDATD